MGIFMCLEYRFCKSVNSNRKSSIVQLGGQLICDNNDDFNSGQNGENLGGQLICDNNDDFNSGQNGENRQPLTTIELKKKRRMTHGR